MYARSRQRRGIEQIFRSSVELWKLSFKAQLPLAFITAGTAILERLYVFNYAQALTPDQLVLDRGYWIVVGACLAINLLAYGAMYAQIDFAARGENMSAARAAGIGLRAWPTMVASTACFLIAVTVGCLLLIVPGIIVSVTLFLYGPGVILERKGVLASLRSSAELVRGNWWLVAIVQTLGFIAFIGVLVLVSLAAGLLGIAFPPQSTASKALDIAASCALAIATTSFFVALILEIYYELKLRKAGSDPISAPSPR